MRTCLYIFIICITLTPLSSAQAEKSPFLIATPNEAFLLPKLLKKVENSYQSIGYQVQFVKLPAGRSLKEAAKPNAYDAELARVIEAESFLPNHIRIEEPLINMTIRTYKLGSPLNISSWNELAGLDICSVKGLITLEKALKPLSTTFVNQAQQCIDMLIKKRVQIAILPDLLTSIMTAEPRYSDIEVGATHIKDIQLYHFISRSHQALVPELTNALKRRRP